MHDELIVAIMQRVANSKCAVSIWLSEIADGCNVKSWRKYTIIYAGFKNFEFGPTAFALEVGFRH